MNIVILTEKPRDAVKSIPFLLEVNVPVKIKQTSKGKYRVSTPGGVKAKGTTKEKAESQRRLLQGVEHGWKPTGKPAKKKAKKR